MSEKVPVTVLEDPRLRVSADELQIPEGMSDRKDQTSTMGYMKGALRAGVGAVLAVGTSVQDAPRVAAAERPPMVRKMDPAHPDAPKTVTEKNELPDSIDAWVLMQKDERKRVATLVRDLDDDTFEVREAARGALVPLLRKSLSGQFRSPLLQEYLPGGKFHEGLSAEQRRTITSDILPVLEQARDEQPTRIPRVRAKAGDLLKQISAFADTPIRIEGANGDITRLLAEKQLTVDATHNTLWQTLDAIANETGLVVGSIDIRGITLVPADSGKGLRLVSGNGRFALFRERDEKADDALLVADEPSRGIIISVQEACVHGGPAERMSPVKAFWNRPKLPFRGENAAKQPMVAPREGEKPVLTLRCVQATDFERHSANLVPDILNHVADRGSHPVMMETWKAQVAPFKDWIVMSHHAPYHQVAWPPTPVAWDTLAYQLATLADVTFYDEKGKPIAAQEQGYAIYERRVTRAFDCGETQPVRTTVHAPTAFREITVKIPATDGKMSMPKLP